MHSWMIAVLLAAEAIAIPQPANALQTSAARDWTPPRRHFSFSGVTFDLDYGNWGYVAHIEQLIDCSNDRYFCLASPTFSVVVPRSCNELADAPWTVGDVTTELLLRRIASSPPLHSSRSATTLFLGRADHPNQMFEYDLNMGLVGLYWDAHRELDFVAMAREGRLERWLDARENDAARHAVFFPRSTFDRVGSCR